MGSVVAFPSKKSAFTRTKHKRLDRQRAVLDSIYAQPYDQWVPLLVKHWPHHLPKMAFDTRLTDALFEEYTLTLLRASCNQRPVEEEVLSARSDVYSQIAEQMLEAYDTQLEQLVTTIQDIPNPKTVFARILNPVVYNQAPDLDAPQEQWEWMSASVEWNAFNPWNGNLDWLAVVACGVHLEGAVFVHQKTALSFEHNGVWTNQEKVYGFALHNGAIHPIPADKVKAVYAIDPVTGNDQAVSKALVFSFVELNTLK